jgi:hypothetical protein
MNMMNTDVFCLLSLIDLLVGRISRRSEPRTRVKGFQGPRPGAIARHKPNVRLLPGICQQPFSAG